MVAWWGRGRTETWPPGGKPRALPWPRYFPEIVEPLTAQLRGYAAAELVPGRLLPWLPVAFGLGIAIYFTAEREPAWWATLTLTAMCVGFAILARTRPIAFPMALALTAVAAGFSVATLKSLQIAHPILQAPAGNVEVAGFVEVREERERSDRIVVRALKMDGIRSGAKPERVRVSVRKGTAPPVRDAINARIRAVIPGDQGAIASALITGKRDAISSPVNDAMYVSSLAHVLSISGYHMAIVAGVVFFALRALLALVPAWASGRPIKKWSALAALLAAAAYLVISGAEVATQRAFIMTAIVLIGVMADRAALTLRTLVVAAFAVLILAPQAVVHPSFQMSFAATLALVAAYERSLRWQPNADTTVGARVALWGGNAVLGLILASLVAGLATTPFAAFHFHRLAPYGVLANLIAMPIVSAWVMPTGLLALIAIPFGFDGFLWRLMGEGIGWMMTVALWVASLPGAVGRMSAFGIGPLLVCSAGLIVLCLLKTPLRWCGAVLMVLATVLAIRAPQPDVLIAADAQALAVRGADGRLMILRQGSDAFTVREWLAADGDARLPTDPALRDGFACDGAGCVGRLASGKLVAFATAPEAFEDDCGRAVLVVTPRDSPPQCAATTIDRKASRAGGARSLRRNGDAWEITAARPPGQDRPWARAMPPATETASPASTPRPQPRDSTPRMEDLEPGD